MKWIGQHIYDFISRFRNDVYLEDVESGTIASDSNLGLDENNKIVKATITSHDEVTLAGTPDYITISGQEITRNAVDLTADVTGTLPVDNGGTGLTSLSTLLNSNVDHDTLTNFAANEHFTQANITTVGTLTGLTTSGTIKLGHASDTTLARSAAGVVTIDGNQIVTDGAVNVASGAGAPIAMRVARRVITQAEMNALHTTPIEIIPAPGANKMIVINYGGNVVFADRAATNTATSTLGIGFDGFTETFSALYERRFMFGVTTDIVYNMFAYTRKLATVSTDAINKKVEAKFFGACTTNCFTALDVTISYWIIDLS